MCVCSDDLECDSFSEGIPLSKEEYSVYTSSKSGDRFSLRTGKIKKTLSGNKSPAVEDEITLAVDQGEVFQTILGIGGAFTGKYFCGFLRRY